MSHRLVGLDFGRGIGILGVILSHSFQGPATNWDTNVLLDLATKVPLLILIVVFIPIVFASLLGSLFFFITAIGVTISSLRIRTKGTKYVWKYIIMKVVFSFLLKFMEDAWKTILKYYPFMQGKIALPEIKLNYFSHSLDNVGFNSWFVPLVVLGITSIPKLHYYYQMAILCVISMILIAIKDYSLSFFAHLATWFQEKEYFFFYYLCMKMCDGHFSIAQYAPYGLVGGAYGILFHNTKDFKLYWKFTWILVAIYFAYGIPAICFVPDLPSQIFAWVKPIPYLFVIGGVQCLAMMLCLQLNDNPNRPIKKRYSLIRNTTFLRRANALSLTAYIMEEAFNNAFYIVFKTFFGPGADRENHICLWPWLVVVVFVILCTVMWSYFLVWWEKADFRFSAESQLGAIMSWLFQIPYNKIDYAKNIYGALDDITAEMTAELKAEGLGNGEGEVIEMDGMSATTNKDEIRETCTTSTEKKD